MRERKYRAWDNVHGEAVKAMVYDTHSAFGGNTWEFWKWLAQHAKMPVMEFTGARDDHDVDIYEDDLVLVGELLTICKWDESLCCYVLDFVAEYLTREPVPCGYHYQYSYFPRAVVGNIHRHPHILEDVNHIHPHSREEAS